MLDRLTPGIELEERGVKAMEKYRKLQCCDFSDFKDKNYDDGVLKLNLTSWKEFHNVVKIFDNNTDYIWRGHRCEKWELKSSFDRDRHFTTINERQDKLDEILTDFKGRLERLEDLPDTETNPTDDEIWAFGQHYDPPNGLPKTPLLDWTQSPYIAAYMAFFKEGTNTQAENRVIYALSRAVKLRLLKTKAPVSKEVLARARFIEVPDVRNNLPNERLRRQKGKFTRALLGQDIRLTVESLSMTGKYPQQIILAEILIPDTFRDECLGFLKTQKLTHGSLFPEYSGAVEICKIELESC